ncbi:glutamine--fructose-6-phosphate transaminase (isomerizing) [Halostella sp. JP-L12]|uniref:glutamine--fructose-6-phosphate transaminase (isomerizing) n=1 Tax=Halostella TaxID=1843185 RepID=UPI000EF848BB|nr:MULTISPECIES: glutamine--fructose-6-phosphate transaminase (isomerizing) [Halostella]NHN49786.1 glutamine--fructose-6-phosphate transaminase (isomerizing) [Halostella sp. JP-L12]
MCGITAHVGTDETVEELLVGLENLEYRGYDSAGVAVKNGCGIEVCKRRGEISQLKQQIRAEITGSGVGIGHTRWSTHGPPTDTNAHPHTDCTGEVAVVHNGIIENHDDLRARLEKRGHAFESDTDTEVVPHLVEEYREDGLSPEAAFRQAVQQLDGSYAVAMIDEDDDAVYATRSGSPLVMGVDDGKRFLASDAPAFLEFTDRVIYLEDGDVAVLTEDGHRITDIDGAPVERPPETVDWVAEDAEKGGYDHYMLKEIHEQPTALSQTLQGRTRSGHDEVNLEDFGPGTFADVSDVQFVACGTSYHAALYATRFLSSRGIQAQAFRAGEYATSPAPIRDETLVVGVTQSGETADTLDSLRNADARGARTLALTNVVGSTAAREADDALFIRAGPEIGVAATKTFSSQIATLALLGERIVRDVSGLASDGIADLLGSLETLDRDVQRVIDESRAERIASTYLDEESYFFIGRDIAYPVALEGALKFKEITYEHAEGFAAGELKHGPLALVTPETPVFAVFTGRHDEKTLNNVEQVQARGAPVIAVAGESHEEVHKVADEVLTYPDAAPEVAAVLANVQLQLLSYHVADRLERAIDKPRNLAKSVTVK